MNTIKFSQIKIHLKIHNIEKKQNLNINNTDSIESKKNSKEDILTISEEAQLALEEKREEMLREMEEKSAMIENFKEQMKASESEESPYEIELKCLLIAMRIIGGDEVPQKDKSFLMEHKPDMYINSITFRKQSEDPKKHKSLLKDKKQNDSIQEAQKLNIELNSSTSTEKSVEADTSELDTSSPEK